MRIAIIVGSTRPARKGLEVAQWVHAHASKRTSAEYELVDLVDYALPLLDEPVPPAMQKAAHAGAHETLGCEGRQLRRLCVRDARVQPRSACRAEERHWTSSTRSGATNRRDSSATAAWALRGPSKCCEPSAAISSWPTCAWRWV